MMHFVEAKGILTGNGGNYGMNIYRGCSHGCIYYKGNKSYEAQRKGMS